MGHTIWDNEMREIHKYIAHLFRMNSQWRQRIHNYIHNKRDRKIFDYIVNNVEPLPNNVIAIEFGIHDGTASRRIKAIDNALKIFSDEIKLSPRLGLRIPESRKSIGVVFYCGNCTLELIKNKLVLQGDNSLSEEFLEDSQGESYRPENIYAFSGYIDQKSKDFVGRMFVFDKINEILQDPKYSSGYILITGEPGIGKSAVAAELVNKYECVHHFNIGVRNIRHPAQFLEGVCSQLIKKYDLPYKVLPQNAKINSNFLCKLLDEVSRFSNDLPLVVVVDALDEADITSLPNDVNALFLPAYLPNNVYFIVTAREKDDLRLCADIIIPVPISDRDPLNIEDIKEYISWFINKNKSDMHLRLQEWTIDAPAFIDSLADRSEGNFQYLRHVLPDILNGDLGPQNIDSVEDLPLGLKSYYQRHWRMMKSRDMHRYKTLQRPILCLLASSKEPVSIDWLSKRAGLQAEDIREIIKEWYEFLNSYPADNNASLFHIYHSSFIDFLDKEEGLLEFHKIIVDHALSKIRFE